MQGQVTLLVKVANNLLPQVIEIKQIRVLEAKIFEGTKDTKEVSNFLFNLE